MKSLQVTKTMRKTRYMTATVTSVSAIILSASMISSVYAQAIPAFPGARDTVR